MSDVPDTERMRCDVLLVDRGLAPSRTRARELIESGKVYSGARRIEKPSEHLAIDAPLELRGEICPYVSRGAFKLLRALDVFGIDVSGVTAVDVGASTGGFTQVLLERGARRVYAVDVGTAQLASEIEADPRVTKMEQTNARTLTRDSFDEIPTLAVMDVSFISILKLLPALRNVLGASGRIVSLVKPQFEAGRPAVGKHGIVSSPAAHEAVLRGIVAGVGESGWKVTQLCCSPILGGDGNVEFLAELLPLEAETPVVDLLRIPVLVHEARAK